MSESEKPELPTVGELDRAMKARLTSVQAIRDRIAELDRKIAEAPHWEAGYRGRSPPSRAQTKRPGVSGESRAKCQGGGS